jgi:hypothetical protein
MQDYDKDTKSWKSSKLHFIEFRDDEVIMTGREDFRIKIFIVSADRLLGKLQKNFINVLFQRIGHNDMSRDDTKGKIFAGLISL